MHIASLDGKRKGRGNRALSILEKPDAAYLRREMG